MALTRKRRSLFPPIHYVPCIDALLHQTSCGLSVTRPRRGLKRITNAAHAVTCKNCLKLMAQSG